MTRDLDPNDPQGEWSSVGPEHWTDYDIPMPNGDFNVTFDLQGDPVETEQMRYLEGFGLPAQQTVSTGATEYLHGDLIRSTMLTTGQGGTAVSAVSYTAFGEVIGSAPETRYQYAGGWGYESDLLILEGAPGTVPITLQHVGHRWYDPSIDRFIQRDPIGLLGGLNVYVYLDNDPLRRIDPTGLYLCPNCGHWYYGSNCCMTPQYPRQPWRPPNPIGPGEKITEGLAKLYLWITPDSWDDPRQVARQRQIAARIALVCIVGAVNPYVGLAVGLGEAVGANEGIIY